jgi:demethylmenaquinone methyltransferase/2-methoxy-6-polyprenyl-1,4-benzoquinol methylase
VAAPDSVADYYDARAPVYDESAGYLDPLAERLRAPIKLRSQKILKGKRVLEIACGTGYWTNVISESAESILATDINRSMIEIARTRLEGKQNVDFLVTDAYTLDGVHGSFDAAFGYWWWSHMPRALVRGFLENLHGRLEPGATVFFVDQLPDADPAAIRRVNENGDTLEWRVLPDVGREFWVIKNFPTEGEIRSLLTGRAESVRFTELDGERSWNLVYTLSRLEGRDDA